MTYVCIYTYVHVYLAPKLAMQVFAQQVLSNASIVKLSKRNFDFIIFVTINKLKTKLKITLTYKLSKTNGIVSLSLSVSVYIQFYQRINNRF